MVEKAEWSNNIYSLPSIFDLEVVADPNGAGNFSINIVDRGDIH